MVLRQNSVVVDFARRLPKSPETSEVSSAKLYHYPELACLLFWHALRYLPPPAPSNPPETFLVPGSPPSKPLKCDHGLRRQALVQSVLTDVFHGRLRAGQHLVTQELADRFGVSHTPVR